MKLMCSVLIAAALIAAVAPLSEAAISCTAVISYVRPCNPYVTGRGPIGSCCSGANRLNAAARTTSDRQSVCNCLKSVTRGYSQASFSRAEGIPRQCGINIPYKISPSTDCAKVR
ncbi:non-specific lipid-transfer protein 2-like [Salvia splendens]|uniref:non-specific lipid-transfer protein 2-like n=1 Tax=Salvia splendens TaxID=180675 RepID=UPI00110477F9|nr:non-specific lipid-transfer protein 2-like [Salvia splendens]